MLFDHILIRRAASAAHARSTAHDTRLPTALGGDDDRGGAVRRPSVQWILGKGQVALPPADAPQAATIQVRTSCGVGFVGSEDLVKCLSKRTEASEP